MKIGLPSMFTLPKLYSRMDAGEQRECLARKRLHGKISSKDLMKKTNALAKRIGKTPEQVRRDIHEDITAMRG